MTGACCKRLAEEIRVACLDAGLSKSEALGASTGCKRN
jgi:hypothetical protein